jgi:hypothetical protein
MLSALKLRHIVFLLYGIVNNIFPSTNSASQSGKSFVKNDQMELNDPNVTFDNCQKIHCSFCDDSSKFLELSVK